MTKCTGLMGQILGHNFIPVITKSPATLDANGLELRTTVGGMTRLMDMYRQEEFHGCICQRCGAVTGEKK
jgi:hypothetical protein